MTAAVVVVEQPPTVFEPPVRLRIADAPALDPAQPCPCCERPILWQRVHGIWCPACRGWLVQRVDFKGRLVTDLWWPRP